MRIERDDYGQLRPRHIAAAVLFDGKNKEWVISECKRYPNPRAVYRWVVYYINSWRS